MNYIIGIFECGCQDGNLSSVEAVDVHGSYTAIEKIKELMQSHSAEGQCSITGATYIFLAENVDDLESYQSLRFFGYDEWVAKWSGLENQETLENERYKLQEEIQQAQVDAVATLETGEEWIARMRREEMTL